MNTDETRIYFVLRGIADAVSASMPAGAELFCMIHQYHIVTCFYVTQPQTEGPAGERTSARTAGGTRRGRLEPRGINCDFAAHGFEGCQRSRNRPATFAEVRHVAGISAGIGGGLAERQGDRARQGGDVDGGVCPGAEDGGGIA